MNFLNILESRKTEFVRKCSRILSVRSTPDWMTTSTSTEEMTLEELSDLVNMKWGFLIEPCFNLLEVLIRGSAEFAIFCIVGKDTNIERDHAFDNT